MKAVKQRSQICEVTFAATCPVVSASLAPDLKNQALALERWLALRGDLTNSYPRAAHVAQTAYRIQATTNGLRFANWRPLRAAIPQQRLVVPPNERHPIMGTSFFFVLSYLLHLTTPPHQHPRRATACLPSLHPSLLPTPSTRRTTTTQEQVLNRPTPKPPPANHPPNAPPSKPASERLLCSLRFFFPVDCSTVLQSAEE
jgi:hypothetical protein